MNAEKTTIVLMLIAIAILIVIKIYVAIGIALLSNDYFVLQQEKEQLQKKNMALNVQYLKEASYGNLYWVAKKEGFVPARYYILK